MSSTNRGGKRSPADFYPTPGWCVDRLIDETEGVFRSAKTCLEPGAGDGAIIRAVARRGFDHDWLAVESRAECEDALKASTARVRVLCADFLQCALPSRVNLAILNPPYSIAPEFLRRTLSVADHTFALLRLNYLGSARRAAFLRDYMPDVYVLPQRPSFTGNGTDSVEYAWFHWSPVKKQTGSIRVLGLTAKEGRK